MMMSPNVEKALEHLHDQVIILQIKHDLVSPSYGHNFQNLKVLPKCKTRRVIQVSQGSYHQLEDSPHNIIIVTSYRGGQHHDATKTRSNWTGFLKGLVLYESKRRLF